MEDINGDREREREDEGGREREREKERERKRKLSKGNVKSNTSSYSLTNNFEKLRRVRSQTETNARV